MKYAILFVLTPMTQLKWILYFDAQVRGGGVILYIHVTCDTIVIQQYISNSQWSRLDTTAHPSTTVYNNKLCM